MPSPLLDPLLDPLQKARGELPVESSAPRVLDEDGPLDGEALHQGIEQRQCGSNEASTVPCQACPDRAACWQEG
jgi:hypothetical protein